MKKSVVTLISFALLLTLFAGCRPALKGVETDKPTVSGGGIVAAQGAYVYYINGTMPAYLTDALADSPAACIYRAAPDGAKERVTSKKVYDFNIYGEWIYYIAPAADSKLVVGRVKADGTGEGNVLTINNAETYSFGADIIGVEQEGKLIVINPLTNEKTTLEAGDISQITTYGQHVYYYIINIAGVRRATNGSKEPEVLSTRNGRIMGFTQEGFYYVKNAENLTFITFAGEETQLSNNVYDTLLLSPNNDYLVGTESGDKAGFYSFPLSGGTRAQITEETIVYYTFYKDKICYYSDKDEAVYLVDFSGKNPERVGKVSLLADPFTNGGYPDFAFEMIEDTLYFFNFEGKPYTMNMETGETAFFGVNK